MNLNISFYRILLSCIIISSVFSIYVLNVTLQVNNISVNGFILVTYGIVT